MESFLADFIHLQLNIHILTVLLKLVAPVMEQGLFGEKARTILMKIIIRQLGKRKIIEKENSNYYE